MTCLKKTWLKLFPALTALLLLGCGSLPKGIDPVSGFDSDRYLGTWFEIARLDHRFERGLTNVSAQYSVRDDGEIQVVNRGYNESKRQWQEAVGRARFARDKDEGFLKVSFFGPFFGSYVIFDLDDNYQRAYVAGDDRDYLWFLSRSPTVSQEQRDEFVTRASILGFDVGELIFVDQSLSAAISQ